MFNRIIEFTYQNRILYQFQFGFRSGHNTSNALMLLVDKMLSGFNNEMTIGVFIDFSKAFDTVTVNYEILFKKSYKNIFWIQTN